MTPLKNPVKYTRMAVSKLAPSESNPRSITDRALDGLSRSIDRFGLVQPIVWNSTTGNVVGGHQRLRVLQERGETMTHVAVVSLSESDERALNIVLNSEAVAGEFTDQLEVLLSDLQGYFPELYDELNMEDLLEPEPAPKEVKLEPKDIPGAILCQRAFMISPEQEAVIDRAMDRAASIGLIRDPRNPNDHGNELATVCALFLELADRCNL